MFYVYVAVQKHNDAILIVLLQESNQVEILQCKSDTLKNKRT